MDEGSTNYCVICKAVELCVFHMNDMHNLLIIGKPMGSTVEQNQLILDRALTNLCLRFPRIKFDL